MSSRLFTPEEVAEYLSVTRRTVYRWIDEEELRACKAGKHWRIREQDLEDFLRWKTPTWQVSVQVQELAAGRKLDAEVSREVLGYEVISTPEGLQQKLPDGGVRDLPRYSSDQAAADLFRSEAQRRRGWRIEPSPPGVDYPDRWFAYLFIDNKHVTGATALTCELAICRVALKHQSLENIAASRESMPRLATPSEVLIREDRDQR